MGLADGVPPHIPQENCMIPAVSRLYVDMAHRCARETLNLVRQGRADEAREVAELAVNAYHKAVGHVCAAHVEAYMALAMRVPHPFELRAAARKRA